MLEHLEFEGFDTKCEFCGNIYSAQYIEFHVKERCLKNPQNIHVRAITNNKNLTVSTSSIKPTNEPNETKFIELPIHTSVVENQSKQNEKKKSCPHCAVLIRPNKYEKHINKKCPVLWQKKKKTLVKINLKSKTLRRKQPLTFTEYDRAFVAVQRNKVRCSKCGQIYLKSEIRCPECLREDLRNQSLTKCPRCEKSFDEGNYNNHLSKCFDPEVGCLICKQILSREGFEKHAHKAKQEMPNQSPKTRIVCEYCKCLVNTENQAKHLNNSCPQFKVECEICKVNLLRHELGVHYLSAHKLSIADGFFKKTSNLSKKELNKSKSVVYLKPLALKKNSSPGKCRICGRIAMYNSGHCYSCGDK